MRKLLFSAVQEGKKIIDYIMKDGRLNDLKWT